MTTPRGPTVGGIAPLLELSPSELESYGVDSLSDLVDALKYLTCESAAAARESRQIAWNFAQELILRKHKCLLDGYSQGARLVRRAQSEMLNERFKIAIAVQQ